MADKTYLDERKSLNEAERESARSFDKAIITLSAGALGFSITFIRQIASDPRSDTLWFLAVAWVALGLALLAILFSFLLSQSAIRRQRDILDEEQENKTPARQQVNVPAIYTNRLNWIAMGFFVIGVAFLAIFSFENLRNHTREARMLHSNHESDERTPEKADHLQEGYVPPKAPVKVEPAPTKKPDSQKSK